MAENKSKDEGEALDVDNLNRSSSFLFDSLYDSSLLAAMDPPHTSDLSDDEGVEGERVGVRDPLPSTQERRRSELLANQEAELQEAAQWGESSFNLSEWGDSLLVGDHFLLKHAERSQRQPEAGRGGEQHPGEQRSSPKPTTSAYTAIKCDPDSHRKAKSRDDDNEADRRRKDGVEMRAVPSHKAPAEHPRGENALFDCSPGVQEIFDRWPSMSDQPCQDVASSHVPNRAGLPGSVSVDEATERREVPTTAPGVDPPEEEPWKQDCEDETERPESAGDLIPPTQEAPPVTPRIKVTTSSVQSPHTAPPLNQSTPSTSRRSQRVAATAGRKPQTRSSDAVGAIREPDPALNLGYRLQEEQKAKSNPPAQPNSRTKPRKNTEQNPEGLADPPGDLDPSMIEAGFSLQVSQDASLTSSNSGIFSIIDVASDRRLFDTFIHEWKVKERYSLALACQRMENRQPAAGKSQRLMVNMEQFCVKFLSSATNLRAIEDATNSANYFYDK